MLAPPVTFEIDGTQYVSILTGNGGGDLFSGEAMDPVATPASETYGNYGRLLVFKVGGEVQLPIPNPVDKSIPQQQLADVSEAEIGLGEKSYNTYCAVCHGLVVRSGGAIADLRRMNEGTHEIFNQIVLEGVFAGKGMASFSDVLTEEDAERIHHYVRARAHEDREHSLGNIEEPKLTWLT